MVKKKRGFGIFVLTCLFLLISVSFVSASLFEDLFSKNKITGEVTNDERRTIENPTTTDGRGILVSNHYYRDDYTLYAGEYCKKIQKCSGFDPDSVVIVDDNLAACRCDDFWGCPFGGTKGPSCAADVSTNPYWERVGEVTCTGCPVDDSPSCGNGVKEFGEQCDDGNLNDGDGCSSTCEYEKVGIEACGNGVVEGVEECDDGNTNNGDGCSVDCELEKTNDTTCGFVNNLSNIAITPREIFPKISSIPYSNGFDIGTDHNFKEAIQSGSNNFWFEGEESLSFRLQRYKSESDAKTMFDIINTKHSRKILFNNELIGDEAFCHTSTGYFERNQKYYFICGFRSSNIYVDATWISNDDSYEMAVHYLDKIYEKSRMNCRGNCLDTDGGINIYKEGVTGTNKSSEGFLPDLTGDTCMIKGKENSSFSYRGVSNCSGEKCFISEGFCTDGYRIGSLHECPEGCVEGACVKEKTTQTTCQDSDGGLNYYKKGKTYGLNSFLENSPWENRTDYCSNGGRVAEFSCGTNNTITQEDYECPNGCLDGACNPIGNNESLLCDSQEIFYEKETRIVNLEEKNYNITLLEIKNNNSVNLQINGDVGGVTTGFIKILETKKIVVTGVEVNVAVVDIEENYAKIRFSLQCKPSKKECSSNSACSARELCIGGVCENVETECSLDVDCPKDYECSNGSCVEISDEVECSLGCSFDGKCYPFGYRKSGEYCNDEYSFVEQREDEAVCDNNFECGSNLCISGQCVNKGLFQRILDFFKGFFS